jgi:hypothetical protein
VLGVPSPGTERRFPEKRNEKLIQAKKKGAITTQRGKFQVVYIYMYMYTSLTEPAPPTTAASPKADVGSVPAMKNAGRVATRGWIF